MSNHLTGTHIRITLASCRHAGAIGVIAEVREGRAHPYRVAGMEPWWFSDLELVKHVEAAA